MKRLMLFILFLTLCCEGSSATRQEAIAARLGRYPVLFEPWLDFTRKGVEVEALSFDAEQNRLELYLSRELSQIAIREELCAQWCAAVRERLGAGYEQTDVRLLCDSMPIENFIPNIYRTTVERDSSRMVQPNLHSNATTSKPLVREVGREAYPLGLEGRHISVIPSHGKYYNHKLDSWIYQRPAMYGTMEDLHSHLYANQYLIPMLEGAGAVTLTPRERDTSSYELIIDRDGASNRGRSITLEGRWRSRRGGFQYTKRIMDDDNPFEMGRYHQSKARRRGVNRATYISKMERDEAGWYALYVSYRASSESSDEVLYRVYDSEGEHLFKVNQQIGGGWLYLGRFNFEECVWVEVESDGLFTTDAVRVGGGVGNVVREGQLSQVARWAEAARYYMQYSGVADSIFHQKHTSVLHSDYIDDYKSRGDWVNFVRRAWGVPLDLSISLHTDAGIRDPFVGTLAIYSSEGDSLEEGDSVGYRFAQRDFADIVKSQIVADIRHNHTSEWVERAIMNKKYSEITSPNIPSMIIELFSHQNFGDMRYALTPQFRFTVARAIYKAMLRYLSDRDNTPYQVAPLAPTDVEIEIEGDYINLRWEAQDDPLEPSATSDYFRIMGDSTTLRSYRIEMIRDGKSHRAELSAHNGGGQSVLNPIIEYSLPDRGKKRHRPQIVVDNAPLRPTIDTIACDTIARGLDLRPELFTYDDYSIIGQQTNFNPESPFGENNTAGWGSCSTEYLLKGIRHQSPTQIQSQAARKGGYVYLKIPR